MAKRRPPLGVWLYGMRIAEIAPKGAGYDLTMRYSTEARDSWPGNSPILSCSLPLGGSPLNPTEYFVGLMPRYGRDVAGAAVVSGEDPEQRAGAAIAYDD